MENEFTVLFDFDSMIYKAVHKVCSFSDVRMWFEDGRSKEWMTTEIMNLSVNRIANMSDGILADIEDTGVNIVHVEYFLTNCPDSVRKKASPLYKANRKKNKWVRIVRRYLLDEMQFAEVHPEWEADDLIKDRAVQLGIDKYVICSLDKDLKQIPGIHFDYYRPILKGQDGKPEVDANGHRKVAPCRGLDIVSEEQAEKFFWKQMLMGDSGDNVKGVPRIGKVKAGRILSGCNNYEETVLGEYIKYFGEDEGHKQFDLHRLLIGLGIENRP